MKKSNLKLKDIVKKWYKKTVSKKANPALCDFFKYVDYLSIANVITIKNQKKLENILLTMENGNYFAKIFTKNKIIKNYYQIFNENFKKENNINEDSNEYVYFFFKSILYSLKANNYLWNTLYSNIFNDILKYKMENYYFVLKLLKNIEFKIKLNKNPQSLNELKIKEDNLKNKLSLLKQNKEIVEKDSRLITSLILKIAENEKIIARVYQHDGSFYKIWPELDIYLHRANINIELKPPMIIKPKKWKKKDNKNDDSYQIYEGGYLNNLFIKLNIDNDKFIDFSSKYLRAINYSQEVPLSINKKYLNWILNLNIKDILSEYSNLNFKNFKDYIKSDWKNLGLDITNQINELAVTLYLAIKYKKFKKIYLPFKMDWRGRTYVASYPLNYYSRDLFKGLFQFSNSKKNKLNKNELNNLVEFLKIHSGNQNLFQKKFEEKKEFYSKKFFFLYKGIEFSPHNSMIGLDACSSSFQIQGIILNDFKMMEYTNVLSNKSKKDIYNFISQKLLEDFNNSKININLNEFYTDINKESKSIKFENEFSLNNFIIKLLENRKLIKMVVMRMGYNQGLLSRTDDIFDFIKTNYDQNLNNSHKKYRWLSRILGAHIEKVFFNEFPYQKLLREFFQKSVKEIYDRGTDLGDVIIYNIGNDMHSIAYQYHKKFLKNIYYRSKLTSKVYHSKFLINQDRIIDKNMMRRAALPNFIQYLDSVIMILFILKCIKKKIKIKTIHDNFLTTFKYLNELNIIYIDTLYDIKKLEPLVTFCLENNLEKTNLNKILNIELFKKDIKIYILRLEGESKNFYIKIDKMLENKNTLELLKFLMEKNKFALDY